MARRGQSALRVCVIVAAAWTLTGASACDVAPERAGVAALDWGSAEAAPARKSPVLSNRAQLISALNGARGGELIVLAAGDYGPLLLTEKRFERPVTVTSADPRAPAVFSSINLRRVQQLALRGIRVKFTPDEKTVQSDSAVFVKDSSGISLTGSRIVGGLAVSGMPESTPAGQLDRTGNVIGRPAARAVTISTSQDVELSGNDVSVFHMGVVMDRVTGAVVARNVIHDLRTTPFAGRQLSRLRIEGNHFHSFRPWRFGGAGDHGDLIHIYTMPDSPPSRDIIIRANWLEQGGGDPLLGIYLDDNKVQVGFLDVRIENNLIVNGNHQGIRLENVRGVVANNTLVLPKGGEAKKAPQILALQKSNVVVTKNILAKVTAYPDSVVTDQDNLLVEAGGKGRGRAYESVFADVEASNPGLRAFGLRASKGVGADIALLSAQLGRPN